MYAQLLRGYALIIRIQLLIIIENSIKFANTDVSPIAKVLKTILKELYAEMPESVIEKMAEKAGIGTTYMASRVATQAVLINLISKKITAEITKKVIARHLAKLGVGFALGGIIAQGMIEKASESAKKLSVTHPKIYQKLRKKILIWRIF